MSVRSRSQNGTISIGPATLAVSRLRIPETDYEATTVVGEMEIPSDSPGQRPRRLIAVGTAIEREGVEIAPFAEVRYLEVDAQPNQGRPLRTESHRRRRSARRNHR